MDYTVSTGNSRSARAVDLCVIYVREICSSGTRSRHHYKSAAQANGKCIQEEYDVCAPRCHHLYSRQGKPPSQLIASYADRRSLLGCGRFFNVPLPARG